MVGCDNNTGNFYSSKRRDKCGACEGYGKSCRIVKDTYYGQKLGWQIVKILPNGTRNIYIKLNATSQEDAPDNVIGKFDIFLDILEV
jgi:hypothetical protein